MRRGIRSMERLLSLIRHSERSPGNLAKRKKYNNYAPTARFFGCAVAPLRMTMRISPFLPSGIPRREHRPYGLCSLL